MKSLLFAMACISLVMSAMTAQSADVNSSPESVTITGEDLYLFSDQPLNDMDTADKEYLNHEYGKAAGHIREAAAWLRAEARHGADDVKVGLQASAKELDSVAGDIENGAVTSSKRVHEAFARASVILAKHHKANAEQAYGAKNDKCAGHDMAVAIRELEHAVEWSGHEIKAGGEFTLKAVREGSGKLLEGLGWSSVEFGKAFAWLGSEIDKMGNAVAPKE